MLKEDGIRPMQPDLISGHPSRKEFPARKDHKLLSIADEISKERQEIDLSRIKESLKMRLRSTKRRAETSERRAAVVMPFFPEVESPIWDHHPPLIQRAITCLENGERFDKDSEGAKLLKALKESKKPSSNPHY